MIKKNAKLLALSADLPALAGATLVGCDPADPTANVSGPAPTTSSATPTVSATPTMSSTTPTTTIKIWPKFAASIATPTTTSTATATPTSSTTTTTSSTTQTASDTTTSTSYITRDPVDKTPGIYVPDFSKSVLKQGDTIKS